MYYMLSVLGIIIIVAICIDLFQPVSDQEAEELYKSLPSEKRRAADRFINWLAGNGK
jgi:hypothetical protein